MSEKKKSRRRLLCLVLSFVLMVNTLAAMGSVAFAEEADPYEITMTAGEVKQAFFQADQEIFSVDSEIAWVDKEGNLKAMKPGKASIEVGDDVYTVNVTEYSDGSDVIGQLKILARYNNDMAFYDGHVYLLFTSYKDGVEIEVPDLYAGYEISDQYYADIREDISNGSNHTGNDTSMYFTENRDMTKVTLNRGEIVTIGMYRDFDLSIADTVTGMLESSTLWQKVSVAGKTAVMKAVLGFLNSGNISAEELLAEVTAIFGEEGIDFTEFLDGKTAGGVCFNRELFNQKLEWDQYENVTYELDITENQLKNMVASLEGNLNNFSLTENSCATVAVNAWNAAVGEREGEDTAYKLSAEGYGIYAIMDAPAGVRDYIADNLPGCYLNNKYLVEEPNASFIDETGWVYVSAPEKMEFEDGPEYSLHLDVVEPDEAKTEVKILNADGDEMNTEDLGKFAPETVLYVKPVIQEGDYVSILKDITLNGVSIYTEENYDADKDAYAFTIPARESWLRVSFVWANVTNKDDHLVIGAYVGQELKAQDYAVVYMGDDEAPGEYLKWQEATGFAFGVDGDAIDETILIPTEAGIGFITLYDTRNPNLTTSFIVEIFASEEDMATVTYSGGNGSEFIMSEITEEGVEIPLLYSGFPVHVGSELVIEPCQWESKVISAVKVNGKKIKYGEKIIVTGDMDIKVEFAEATITNLPKTVSLEKKGDIYQLNAKVSYSGRIYDSSIRYESSDPMVEVNSVGRIKVVGDVPEEGKAVMVTAYAGSGNDRVYATCKVMIGNYTGENVVGRLTIYARPIAETELIAHGCIAFTPYEDMDLDISYYQYYRPKDEFIQLLTEYDKDTDSYPSDPALYSEDIPLENRSDYFEEFYHGAHSDPATVSVMKNEVITISNYGFDESNVLTLLRAMKDSTLYGMSDDARQLVDQMEKYVAGEEIDGVAAFDGMLKTLVFMYQFSSLYGFNPADHESVGGLAVNREIYNQFRRNDSQMPNYYYSVEITEDELEMVKTYLADPANNYYSLFNKNCAGGAVDVWNLAMYDRPELQITANISGMAVDPQSLNLELKKMGMGIDDLETAGADYYPRSYYPYEEDIEEPVTYSSEWVDGLWYDKDGSQTYEGIGQWYTDSKGKYYMDSLGWYPKCRWQKIDGKWYYFTKTGYVETDCYRKGKYLTETGEWDEVEAGPGWVEDGDHWRYVLADNSELKSTWMKIDGKWFYFHESGLAAQHEFVDGWWLNDNCTFTYAYQSTWREDDRGWWYGDDTGWYARNGSFIIDQVSYNFNKSGYCTNR